MSDVRVPSTIPVGRTARRLEWTFLPPHVRDEVERRCGSPVAAAESQGAGFTPGFASVLTCADGSRHFVKAASVIAQRVFAESYREEARKLGALPPETPAPALQWIHDADDWVVLGIEHVDARAPHRPWQGGDLEAAMALTARMAEVLTPVPEGLEVDSFAEEFGSWPSFWQLVPAMYPDLPHVEEATALAAAYAGAAEGDTLVHTDIRDDNILIRPDGTALACDWNWPVRGAAWLDTLFALIGPRGDGLDVEQALATHRLTRDVPPDEVDAVLALVTGYFLKAARDPVPVTSPHLRDHQRWQAQVCWAWLSERRGWT